MEWKGFDYTPLPPPRVLTPEEYREHIFPEIQKAIQRILTPTEEEKKQLKAVVDDFPIFEWEVVLNNNKKE